MSSAKGYADSLSAYAEKGKLNLQNQPESPITTLQKSRYLAELIKSSSYVVMHTGAGISTSAGIADFRGPDGVWTTEKRPPKRPRRSTRFHRAIPTITHMALVALHKKGFVKYLISQNVDSLHLRSGFPSFSLSELHGNIFVEYCPDCKKQHLRETPVSTVGLKRTGNKCPCGGDLHDRALDWEDPLPEPDYEKAQEESAKADLNIVLGTSCQMEPARLLPFRGKGGKAAVVLVNLSETPFDDKFGLRIRAKCDTVLAIVATHLGLRLDVFERRVGVMFDVCWIDRDTRRFTLKRSDGGVVDGVQAVRYGDIDGTGELFEAVMKESPQALVALDDGRETCLPTEGKDLDIIIDRKDWNYDAFCLGMRLARQARTYEGDIELADFYVTGRRRGWGVCCLCRAEVWCSRGRRVGHLEDCLRRWRSEAEIG